MVTEIARQLPSRPEAVVAARRALEGLADRLPPDRVALLRLLVSELVTNSIRHGAIDAEQPVRLTVRVAGDRVRVEVEDGGAGFVPPPEGPRPREESGWGLVLVDALAERWGVDRDGATRVWFEVPLALFAPSTTL
jgi:anti-sigma regulatory factor (Ser/Thr protein kinase)